MIISFSSVVVVMCSFLVFMNVIFDVVLVCGLGYFGSEVKCILFYVDFVVIGMNDLCGFFIVRFFKGIELSNCLVVEWINDSSCSIVVVGNGCD